MDKIDRLFFSLLCLVLFASPARAAEATLPLLQPIAAGWRIQPLLNVGDAVGASGYRMAGVPDGLGAFSPGDGSLTLLMNHELAADKGVTRRHGGRGAFVSRWRVQLDPLRVVAGEDLIARVELWDRASGQYQAAPAPSLSRLCSADLAAPSAFYDAASGVGFKGRLFLNGEEDRPGGRAFAHVVTGPDAGTSFELPDLGRIAWENAVANPHTGAMTLVMGMDDSPNGQVYVYTGQKRNAGNPVERAGLRGGELAAIKAEGPRFSLARLEDAAHMSAEQLDKATREAGGTAFLRPEDGAWDPCQPGVFYFATTDKIDGSSQLFRLTFDDILHPQQGGRIEVLLNARDIGAQMFDNLVVDGDGRLLIEEDPGENPHAASIWLFDPATKLATKIAAVAPEHFVEQANPQFLTQDEENSGIIEVTEAVRGASWFDAGRRYYLGVLQVHLAAADAELVEGGQLYLLSGPVAAR